MASDKNLLLAAFVFGVAGVATLFGFPEVGAAVVITWGISLALKEAK